MAIGTLTDLPKRIQEKFLPCPISGCWFWIGAGNRNGYGTSCKDNKQAYAHRVVYEYLVGPIPEGLELDHLCRVRCCVNPRHVEPVTPLENMMRGESFAAINARKTHCIHGHPLSGDNLIVRPHPSCRTGFQRACRVCYNRAIRDWKRARRPKREPKTHCLNGHPVHSDSFSVRIHKSGPKAGKTFRRCKTCQREAKRRSAAFLAFMSDI